MVISVYAICKNEASFAEAWMESMREADEIVVLDTGSEDGTPEKLRSLGAKVEQKEISPWRFDAARNESLKLVSPKADICVCTDLDERFAPGWREKLEASWTEGATQARYRYTWSFFPDGREDVVFWPEKIHARFGYRWTHPVHEILSREENAGPGKTVTAEGVQLNHYPDPKKSRAQYLELLELSVREDPEDDRNMYYLGREYFFRGRYEECIRTLQRHLGLKRALWVDERAASMRYIADSFVRLGKDSTARDWYLMAIAQAPHLREGYVELADFLYDREQWEGVIYFVGCALQITERTRTYLSQAKSWGSHPYDLLAIAYYQTGQVKKAWENAAAAVEREPENERLLRNEKILKAEKEKLPEE